MREDDSNWFSKWEEQLPSPDELMPLSQTLISPDLALAFDIRSNPNPSTNNNNNTNIIGSPQHAPPTPPPPPANSLRPATPTHPISSADFADSADLGSGGGGGGGGPGDEPARTLKRPRLVWTPQLHKRFVDAVAHLGIKNAVPKTIMQLMSVDGLTRENVASHLQKYRLYLKRMQGLSAGTGGGGGSADPATDHLFASSPVPAHFLHPGRPNSEHFLPFVPVAMQHHHHQQQQQQQQHLAAAAAVAATHPQMQQTPPFHHHRQPQVGHFGSPPNPNGQFEHPFLARQSQAVHRMAAPIHSPAVPGYVEDMESANATGAAGRKVLTLFPTGED